MALHAKNFAKLRALAMAGGDALRLEFAFAMTNLLELIACNVQMGSVASSARMSVIVESYQQLERL